MAEELRIVVTDAGGAGGGGRGGGGLLPGAVGNGGVFVAPSVARPSAVGSILSGVGTGVGIAAFNAIRSTAHSVAALPSRVVSTLASQASDLAGLSAPLAQAVAESNLRSFDVRRRRAATIGGALAGFETTRSQFGAKVGDLWTEILKVMLSFFDAVKPLIERIASNIESMTDIISRELPNFLEGFADALPFWFDFIKEPLHVMARSLRAMEKAAEEANLDGFFEQLMRNLVQPVGFWPGDQQAPGEGDRAFRRRARRAGF